MTSEMMKITDIVEFNPKRTLKKGIVAPFVEMAAVPEHTRDIAYTQSKIFSSGSKFKNGDTLFSRITPCLENGKTAKVGVLHKDEVGHGSTEFIVMAAKHHADEDFVYYLSLLPDFRKFAESRMEGTSGRQRVSWQALAEYKIPSIDPATRKEIGKILRSFDDKIELNRQINQTLEAMAQAIFKSWFVDFDPVRAKIAALEAGEDTTRAAMRIISGKTVAELERMSPEQLSQLQATASLFPSAMTESELGEVPEGWEYRSIYEISSVVYGAPFKSKQFITEAIGIPLVRIRDLKNEIPAVSTEEKHPKGYLIENGDLLVGMDGEFKPHIWGGGPAWMNQRICCFKPKNDLSNAVIKGFISPQLDHLEKTATATTVIHLGKGDIDKFVYLQPNSELLSVYSDIAESIYKNIVNKKVANFSLAETRDTLLPKLLSGEIF